MKVIIAVICSLLFIGGCGDDPQTYWINSTGQDNVEVGTDSDETRDTGSIEDYETYEGYLDSETLWESESQTEAQTDWDSQTETESESQTEAQTDWDSDSESQTEFETDQETESQTDWDSESESLSDGSTDSETEEETKKDECDNTAECQAIYGPAATDCVNSKSDNSFCRCGAAPCRVTTGAK